MIPTGSMARWYDDISENMLRFFEGGDTRVPHMGERGGIRERRVMDFLKANLPQKYDVGSGHIIDREGNVSLQEDIVIFDRLNCVAFKIDPYYHLFPCESVVASIEAKSKLDSTEIDKCIQHTRTLHGLYRGDDDRLGQIESIVFAYDSYAPQSQSPIRWANDTFRKKITESEDKPMPSLVLCLKHKFLMHLGGPDGKSLCIAERLSSGILLSFFEKLLHRISLVQVQPSSPSLFYHYGWGKDNAIEILPDAWRLE